MNKLTAEKCREQFEGWGKSQRCELDKWVRGDKAGEYKNPVVAKLWQAWQASRQAVEIALPVLEQQGEAAEYQYYYHNHGTGSGEWLPLRNKQAYEEMKKKYAGVFS